MGWISRLFGRGGTGEGGTTQSVVLHFPIGGAVDRPFLERLEMELGSAAPASRMGRRDGHGPGGEYCEILLHGPDADALFDAVAPVIEKHPLPKGSHAIKRYGDDPNTRSERVNMEWQG